MTEVSTKKPGPVAGELDRVREITRGLLKHCRTAGWAGWDPFDGLNSRVFHALPFMKGRWPRLLFMQAMRRSPVNLRPLLGVPREQNPKGIALFLASLVRLERWGWTDRNEIRALADRLLELRSSGWRRPCWGYHFDWETRTYLVPRGYPNIICTTFAAEALLDADAGMSEGRYRESALGAGWFLLEELKRTGSADSFCLSYTPLRPSEVHNASLLGGALLARLHALTGEPAFREAALGIAAYGLRHQQEDGSWIYGEGLKQRWIDSFHTGYNLLALDAIGRHLDWKPAHEAVRRGFVYYCAHFFAPDGMVKYFHDRAYPVDAHAVAHAVLTLAQLAAADAAKLRLAADTIDWARRRLRDPSGYFYYQRWPWFANRTDHMRWSQAWMLRGLAEFLVATADGEGVA